METKSHIIESLKDKGELSIEEAARICGMGKLIPEHWVPSQDFRELVWEGQQPLP